MWLALLLPQLTGPGATDLGGEPEKRPVKALSDCPPLWNYLLIKRLQMRRSLVALLHETRLTVLGTVSWRARTALPPLLCIRGGSRICCSQDACASSGQSALLSTFMRTLIKCSHMLCTAVKMHRCVRLANLVASGSLTAGGIAFDQQLYLLACCCFAFVH